MFYFDGGKGYYCYHCGTSFYPPANVTIRTDGTGKIGFITDGTGEIEFLTDGTVITYQKERK
jgi:uncharacterized OB-fold protein